MVTASFLNKDLHLNWRLGGAQYSEEQLLDGNSASNRLNWQWNVGIGTDAAPYFRIFDPILQSTVRSR
nr:FAD-binding domain-containing protein [Ferrimicrobium sp.]